MNHTESVFRVIKDRVAAAIGELEEACTAVEKKENHRRLSNAAAELHKCADEMQNVLMRVKPK
jgi:hypothetical protein